ncbi:hypothetical protein NT2_07_01430 [Caenibius tardaugens NBRC 16725]|uniref:Methyltransferase type 11 domain-containing protein n=1 Tax=Caenibius tardaugens NBRC 16725 TaxID=1219035 RepID=U3A5X0_9SPHN|nr:class I SAM-dependent methyltransferase [Caenibius tardaugens]GAD50143.1 hypothetical protein NT2_07_01430 [Caenibius tardaugens NBRC 16725]
MKVASAPVDDEPVAALAKPVVDPNSQAQRDFERLARAAGMDPANPWIGGYVAYEWRHLRKLLDVYGLPVDGRTILEFGCNVGGSSVVLAALGADVTAIDVDPDMIGVAQANIARHHMDGRAQARHVTDTRQLPFESAAFDLVIANSVLEYVDPDHLDQIMAELHRVVRPGGLMFICGTASRLAMREIHSRRWLVNFVPRWLDRWTGMPLQRGLSPMHLARCLKGRFVACSQSRWLVARRALHGRPSSGMHALAQGARLIGCSPGWLAPNMELLLQRQDM